MADVLAEQIEDLILSSDVTYDVVKEALESLLERLEVGDEIALDDNNSVRKVFKKTDHQDKARSVAEAVLKAVEGDLDAFCACLKSKPFKHAHTRNVLNDEKERYFWKDVTTTVELRKENEQIKRRVK